MDACPSMYNAHCGATYASPHPHAGRDVDMCCYCGRGRAEKAPPPQWGPLNPSGKFWGPIEWTQEKAAMAAAPPQKMSVKKVAKAAPSPTKSLGGQQQWLSSPGPLDGDEIEDDVVGETI